MELTSKQGPTSPAGKASVRAAPTTLYLARHLDMNIRRDEVDRVVKNCRECQSIDPNSSRIDG